MPPAIPVATYRVQLSATFRFSDAAALVPYLKLLGISHLYASPFFKSRAGSTHGYDVVDHNTVDPELGGEEGLERLCHALAEADMGLILDFVPNHMGIHHADNPWWLDVLEWGPKSPFAASFDIDWKSLPGHPRGGVLVPILGSSYGEVLNRGEIALRYDEHAGSFSAWYYEHQLPIGPNRYGEILQKVVATAGASAEPAGRNLLELAARYHGPSNPSREEAAPFKAAIAAVQGGHEVIGRGLRAYDPRSDEPGSLPALHYLLERQHYRLANWRLAVNEINYRRFFDINDLAGLRVEDASTFQAIHDLVRRLIARGWLHGLRLDHIDGLRDPHQYFRRLQQLVNSEKPHPDAPFYVVIEKILAEGERLPRFAGVSGATGYEWLNCISRVLLDEKGLQGLDAIWHETSGDPRAFDEIVIDAKRRVVANILASEFTVLARLLARIAAGHYTTRDFGGERLRAALELFVLHFPVYRTYITPSGPSRGDRAIINDAIAKARADWFGSDVGIFDFLHDALTLDLVSPGRTGHSIARDRQFAFKVQQFTGPMMAKSLEDTAFYRYHCLLALNEVGGNPALGALSVPEFHKRMIGRVDRASRGFAGQGLTATATHDTKRGEDARTRLLALSELAPEWMEKIREWRMANSHLADLSAAQRVPAASHEYMIYQSMLGAWPLESPDPGFVERTQAYAVKAAREGKEHSSWLAPDECYEAGLKTFISGILDPSRSESFLQSFDAFARRTALLGALNSLTQLALKAAMPGVPDFYQGTEFWDLSFVDPDNRRAVDFSLRSAALASIDASAGWSDLAQNWPDGRIKLALTRAMLALRNQSPDLFTRGSYRQLEVSGPHSNEIIAFARIHGRDAVLVVTGRLFNRATRGGRHWPTATAWNASVSVDGFTEISDAIGANVHLHGPALGVSTLFGVIPIAVLRASVAPAHHRSLVHAKESAPAE
jgi:(1->4)-alpha-D-glucan 1-alpha-D-glucosylmutase